MVVCEKTTHTDRQTDRAEEQMQKSGSFYSIVHSQYRASECVCVCIYEVKVILLLRNKFVV